MKKSKAIATSVLMLGFCFGAYAQGTQTPRVLTCDTTIAPQSPLTVLDEASHKGARVENPALITLPNGMKAVQFSVRHVRSPDLISSILKVRYTVHWTDDCGRHIKVGNDTVDGFALDPQRQRMVQSNAMSRHATHAALRIYIVD